MICLRDSAHEIKFDNDCIFSYLKYLFSYQTEIIFLNNIISYYHLTKVTVMYKMKLNELVTKAHIRDQ